MYLIIVLKCNSCVSLLSYNQPLRPDTPGPCYCACLFTWTYNVTKPSMMLLVPPVFFLYFILYFFLTAFAHWRFSRQEDQTVVGSVSSVQFVTLWNGYFCISIVKRCGWYQNNHFVPLLLRYLEHWSDANWWSEIPVAHWLISSNSQYHLVLSCLK